MLNILTIPIVILNFGSGIVGGIWLSFLGEVSYSNFRGELTF